MYRVINGGLSVSLNDLRTVYTIDDYYDFHEYLDLKDEAEFLASQENKKG